MAFKWIVCIAFLAAVAANTDQRLTLDELLNQNGNTQNTPTTPRPIVNNVSIFKSTFL